MKWKNEDIRANFANEVCLLQIKHFDYDFYEAADNLGLIYDMFFENIRNIYELTTSELPLFTLYELIHTDNLDDWCKEELNMSKDLVISEVIEDCRLFYSKQLD